MIQQIFGHVFGWISGNYLQVWTWPLDIAKSLFRDVANKAPTIPRAEPMTQPAPSKVGTPWVVGHTEIANVKPAPHTS